MSTCYYSYCALESPKLPHSLGNYQPMDASALPALWLAYLGDPSDSGKLGLREGGSILKGNRDSLIFLPHAPLLGKIHSNVKQRWLQEDEEVIGAMEYFAELTDKAKFVYCRNGF